MPEFRADEGAEQRTEFRTLDEETQDLKKQVLDLNRDLFLLEEELLFPSNTQTAVFISMDVGEFFGLDSVELKIDDKDVANYLYTEREAEALLKGGVQRLFIGNLKAGEHELVAVFTGQGPHTRDYRRGGVGGLREGDRPEVHRAHDLGSRDQATAGVRRQGVGVAGGGSSPHRGGSRAARCRRPMRPLHATTMTGIVVQDLAYGEVLFEFFQEDYFAALTRLLAAQQRGELAHHGAEAELMLGGLYLSYGQHRLAGEIFERVLAAIRGSGAARPRLVLSREDLAAARLSRRGRGGARRASSASCPRSSSPSGRCCYAQVLMEQGRFADALAALEAWRRPGDAWVGYAKYNIGVSLVRLGQVEAGARVLDEVGQLDPENPAFDALRDKANVALGYAWLQAARPVEAKPSLQRVRLDGPFSNKALLGVGWSDAEAADYRAALAPWLALRERSLLDSAVQESLLAVPYAFAQLGADKQAADHYVDAIEAFSSEIVRLTSSIESIENGELITELLGEREDVASDASGWYWRLERIPDSVESRYLYELLASNRFQEGLKNYRDLTQMNRNLDRWVESLGAFDDILDTRQRAYVQRLPSHRRELVERRPRRDDAAPRRARVSLAGHRAQRGRRRARHGQGAGDAGACSRPWSRSSRRCRTMPRARRCARSIASCAASCCGICSATTKRGSGPSARRWAISTGSSARRNGATIRSRARATIGPRSSRR